MKSIALFTALFLCIFHLLGQEKPNVLFIAIDDLNDYVNCMDGSIKIPTPNIDKLASEGILFTNAHCQAPICGPSRASVMTGLYPSTSGNYLQLKDTDIMKGSEMMSKATFMPDYFEEHGYKTMAVGKIYHNGDAARTFDEYGSAFKWYGPKPKQRVNYDPSKIDYKIGKTQTDWGAYPEHDSLMPDYKSAQWAIDKIQQRHEKPFFLAVGFIRPHVPWHVPKKWFDMFPIEYIKTPPYNKSDFDDIPRIAQRVTHAPMMPTTEELIKEGEWKKVIQAYMACVAFVDNQVGKVLEALKESDYSENTIVVLWSDHGYHLGEKNRFAKMSLWERDTRTVLILKDVKNSNRQIVSEPVQLLDIYPTLIDLCDLPQADFTEGHSLIGLMNGSAKEWAHPAISFFGEGNVSIRDKRFRLIRYEDHSNELYDLKNDPNEWNNLAQDKKYRKTIKRLTKDIPNNWVPISPYVNYDFNEYFIEKLKKK